MRIVALLALAIVIGGVLAGCGGFSTAQAEKALVAYAPELIGPADSYRAELRGLTPTGVEALTLTGIGVRPDPNLIIDPLTLTLTGVRYQVAPFRLQSVAGATFEGRVSEAAINAYLQQLNRTSNANIKRVRVSFETGLVRVSAGVTVLNVDVPVITTGRLQVTDGLRVNYQVESLRVAGVGVPTGITTLLANLVNPIVDLSGLRFTPHVTRLLITPGALTVGGTATLRTLNGMPASQPASPSR